MKFSDQSILNEGTYPETPIISQLFPKSQIKSKWIYEIIYFPKNEPKNLKDYYKNSQGRNPSNFSGHFLEINDFLNSF